MNHNHTQHSAPDWFGASYFKEQIMAAGVERIGPRKFHASCPECAKGLITPRRVDAHIWATEHNRENHIPKGTK